MDNLRFWYSKKDIKKELDDGVLKLLGIPEFIHVPVKKMSGGMKKRLSIGCAVAQKPPLHLLDEPTAALDPIAEYEIYSKFNEIVEDKTAIYISHRLSSCRFCDSIAVFDHGELVQIGSHDVLAADENGKYSELWHAQAQYYEK